MIFLVYFNIFISFYLIRTVSGVTCGYFSEIPVVITLHLEVKYFALGIAGLWNQVFVQETLEKKKYCFY